MIDPVGGALVSRRSDLTSRDLESLPSVQMDAVTEADLELIADGAYSPLTGFMSRDDYDSVVDHAALGDGNPWTLPVTLPVDADVARELSQGSTVTLRDTAGVARGTLEVR